MPLLGAYRRKSLILSIGQRTFKPLAGGSSDGTSLEESSQGASPRHPANGLKAVLMP